MSQLRTNIRNAMFLMTCMEATDYRDSLEGMESIDHADEFLCDLEADFNGIADFEL
jgi:hypothetical protein